MVEYPEWARKCHEKEAVTEAVIAADSTLPGVTDSTHVIQQLRAPAYTTHMAWMTCIFQLQTALRNSCQSKSIRLMLLHHFHWQELIHSDFGRYICDL